MSPQPFATLCTIFVLLTLGSGGSAQGQDISQRNMDFDRRFNEQLQRLQQQNSSQMQQVWQQYLHTYGPWLRQQYQQQLAAGNTQLTFEQFAYWMLMTANGTNIAGAQEAQRRQFEGNQQANRTVQEAYQRYNEEMRRNSQRHDRAVENWDRQVVQGNAPYIDPTTGQIINLPYATQPGQVISSGGRTFRRDEYGRYQEWRGNGWIVLNPAAR